MFYYYIRIFNWFSSIFGLHRPYISTCGRIQSNRWLNVWSLIVSVSLVTTYLFPNNFWSLIKKETHLDEIANVNNLIFNIIIILVNVINGNTTCFRIYSTMDNILSELYIQKENLKLFAIKLFVWIALPFILFIILIITEFFYANPPYSLIVKMPMFLTILHLVIHVSLVLAVLKVINLRLLEKFKLHNNFFLQDCPRTVKKLHYFLTPVTEFFHINIQKQRVDLKTLCKIYDDLGICINLLQNNHGFQMLLSVWLMFSNAVTGITLMTLEQANVPWVVICRSILPFVWYFMGCYVDNQLRQEVFQTNQIILKYLIDFRCDQPTREVLETFKQVLEANRLEFTACNLFRQNYATVLGTVVNVITYSIILIQVL